MWARQIWSGSTVPPRSAHTDYAPAAQLPAQPTKTQAATAAWPSMRRFANMAALPSSQVSEPARRH